MKPLVSMAKSTIVEVKKMKKPKAVPYMADNAGYRPNKAPMTMEELEVQS